MKGCEKGQEKGHKQRRWWAALTPLDLPKEWSVCPNLFLNSSTSIYLIL
jgi:hypothetical protein